MIRTIILALILTGSAHAQMMPFGFWKPVSTAPASWTPDSLGDSLKYWYAADDLGITKTNGDTTYYWNNKAQSDARTHLYQSIDSRKPVYRDSSGVRWLVFDGTDDYIQTSTSAPLYTQPGTIIAVWWTNTAADNRIYYDGAGTAGRNAVYQEITQRLTMFAGANGFLTPQAAVDSVRWGIFYFSGASSTGNVRGFINSVSAGTQGQQGVTIGASRDGGSATNLRMYEYLYLHRALTAYETTKVIDYYKTKYSIP